MKKGILTGCVLFLCISANAQKVDKDLRLQEVEVTAKRPLKNTGIEKTQLDTLVLHDNIALSMADILQQSSTLFIKSYGRATESTAEFRGTSPSHTQVTWNGMKINFRILLKDYPEVFTNVLLPLASVLRISSEFTTQPFR